jgi:hypothetical protein
MDIDPLCCDAEIEELRALAARLAAENAALKAENQALAAELLASRASLVRVVRSAASAKILAARADTVNAPSDKRLRARLAGAAGKLKDALDDAAGEAITPSKQTRQEAS